MMTKDEFQKSAERVKVGAFVMLLLDVLFVFWAIARLIFIAFPSSVYSITGSIIPLFGMRVGEANIEIVYTSIGNAFLLAPPTGSSGHFVLPGVAMHIFLSAVIAVGVFVLYSLLNMLANYVLVKAR